MHRRVFGRDVLATDPRRRSGNEYEMVAKTSNINGNPAQNTFTYTYSLHSMLSLASFSSASTEIMPATLFNAMFDAF